MKLRSLTDPHHTYRVGEEVEVEVIYDSDSWCRATIISMNMDSMRVRPVGTKERWYRFRSCVRPIQPIPIIVGNTLLLPPYRGGNVKHQYTPGEEVEFRLGGKWVRGEVDSVRHTPNHHQLIYILSDHQDTLAHRGYDGVRLPL